MRGSRTPSLRTIFNQMQSEYIDWSVSFYHLNATFTIQEPRQSVLLFNADRLKDELLNDFSRHRSSAVLRRALTCVCWQVKRAKRLQTCGEAYLGAQSHAIWPFLHWLGLTDTMFNSIIAMSSLVGKFLNPFFQIWNMIHLINKAFFYSTVSKFGTFSTKRSRWKMMISSDGFDNFFSQWPD